MAEQCPEQPLRGPQEWADTPDEVLIDDFEGAQNEWLPKLGGRDGAWVMGSDETAADPFAGSAPDCVARGEHSGHFRGEGYSDWGANWTAVFRQTIGAGGPAQSYDGSQFTGLSFWAAVGPELGEVELPLGITTLDVAWNGGVCTQCMDYYRTAITLDAVWKRYTVRFQDMTQSGVGDPLLPIRTDQLVGFILWPSGPFDLWIDDLRFER